MSDDRTSGNTSAGDKSSAETSTLQKYIIFIGPDLSEVLDFLSENIIPMFAQHQKSFMSMYLVSYNSFPTEPKSKGDMRDFMLDSFSRLYTAALEQIHPDDTEGQTTLNLLFAERLNMNFYRYNDTLVLMADALPQSVCKNENLSVKFQLSRILTESVLNTLI